jgi:glycerol-3-phosphate dehydrogenase
MKTQMAGQEQAVSFEQQATGRYAALATQDLDLLVIGGGIIGCGIARDAALRGLKVALFEKEDFGSGTSSRSTRLIHGGLRYLEQFDFGLVRQDLREREILLKTAPHRVAPLRFLVPLYNRSLFYHARLRAGMLLYDLLSYDKSLPKHRFLSRAETLALEPGLAETGLQGAASYYDAQCAFVERLCLDNVTDAVENGAQAYNHTEVIELRREERRVTGLAVRDTLTGETVEVKCCQIVNASGPWLDRLTGNLTGQSTRRLRLTKGVHFAAPSAVEHALVLFSQQDGRLFFVIPWLGNSWVGTTDTDYNGDPDTVCADAEDVRYLQAGVEPVLPCADWNRIYYTSAGLRALVRESRRNAPESDVSRKHRLVQHTREEGWEGLYSVLGGKITAYRDIAEEVVSALMNQWRQQYIAQLLADGQKPRLAPLIACSTHKRPLPGGELALDEKCLNEAHLRAKEIQIVTKQPHLTISQVDNLIALYGANVMHLLERLQTEPELSHPIAAPYPDLRIQIAYAVQHEWALTVSDFMLRRSMLGFTPDQGQAALEVVATEMGRLLGWDAGRIQHECAAYGAHIALTQAFRLE